MREKERGCEPEDQGKEWAQLQLSELVSGLLPDILSEPLSGFLWGVENLHQDRMGEASLSSLSVRALPCSWKGSCPTDVCAHMLII